MSIRSDEEEDDEEEDETPESRFTNHLLRWLLRGFPAKDKNVRFRCCQLVTMLITNGKAINMECVSPPSPCSAIHQLPPELDRLTHSPARLLPCSEDLFGELRRSLLERARDKEVAVRVQALLGLTVYRDEEPEDDDGEDVMELLLDALGCDPAASVLFLARPLPVCRLPADGRSSALPAQSEVRQTALFLVPVTPQTLPLLLQRTRDVDPSIRRNAYLRPLSAEVLPPSRLSMAQREEIVRNGLGDRDDKVRKAAGGLVVSWMDTLGEGGVLKVSVLSV